VAWGILPREASRIRRCPSSRRWPIPVTSCLATAKSNQCAYLYNHAVAAWCPPHTRKSCVHPTNLTVGVTFYATCKCCHGFFVQSAAVRASVFSNSAHSEFIYLPVLMARAFSSEVASFRVKKTAVKTTSWSLGPIQSDGKGSSSGKNPAAVLCASAVCAVRCRRVFPLPYILISWQCSRPRGCSRRCIRSIHTRAMQTRGHLS